MINQTTKDRIKRLWKTYTELSAGREHILHDIAIAEIPEKWMIDETYRENM